MERETLPNADLYLESGFWKLRWREDGMDSNGSGEWRPRKPVWIGPSTGPERLTRKQAQQTAQENFLSRVDQNARVPRSAVTIADFVERVFVPEHVAKKGLSGRTHYQAILKHVLGPGEVDRMFRIDPKTSKAKLKAFPDWPYLGHVRLCDARPDDVQRLISAAVAHGYSAQTVKHIRSVVSAIFAHATRKQCFGGDNPASRVTLPEMTRKEAHVLTLAQAKQVLGVMQYPEKEMAMLAVLTNMKVEEICGLQWKCVNLTDAWSSADGKPIPPKTIAVRKEWYGGELAGPLKGSRHRNLPIPEALLPILLLLSRRDEFNGPDDFVLVSRVGTPIHEANIAKRRLKTIGKDLQMPWLSWQVFRRTHRTLAFELGIQLLDGSLPGPEGQPVADSAVAAAVGDGALS